MSLLEKMKNWFGKKESPEAQKTAVQESGSQKPVRLKKTCKSCGKTFSYDPSWDHIPNFCKDCKQKLVREKEEKQRAGKPRQIKRTCKKCGKFFTFPSTLPHYPNYCNNCRKIHQAEMKAKYHAL